MGDGMRKPQSTVDTLKSRGTTIDDAVDDMTAGKAPKQMETAGSPTPSKPVPKKGMPKPSGILDKVKKFVGLSDDEED